MIGNEFDIPIMYQDLTNSSMPPMNIPFGGMTYNTSYLNGTKIRPQLNQDEFSQIEKKENQDKSTLKKALIALTVIIGLGAIPPLTKSIKKAGGIINYVKGLFTKKPVKPSLWSRFKGGLSKFWGKTKKGACSVFKKPVELAKKGFKAIGRGFKSIGKKLKFK